MTKLSIILPLFDRRTAGWQSLESALGQTYPRERYEVVVVGGKGGDDPLDGREITKLLARCDTVVRTDFDTGDVASEIELFRAGFERSTGDVLLFMEGHTVLEPRCLEIVSEHLRRHPGVEIAWAPRNNRSESRLGGLVTMHNLSHERRALANGVFTLGATNVITRALFDRLGGFDATYLRFTETAIFHRALASGIAIGRIAEPLATHHNDMPATLWRKLVTSAGEAKFGYYNALVGSGVDLRLRVRHGIYLAANHRWIARVLYPLLRAGSRGFLALSTATSRLSMTLAYRLYVLAIGCTDLSGFCRARLRG